MCAKSTDLSTDVSTDQHETGVDETEGAGAPDAGAAVDDGRPDARLQRPGPPHRQQEVEEGGRRLRHPEVRPRRVVELQDLLRLPALCAITRSSALGSF